MKLFKKATVCISIATLIITVSLPAFAEDSGTTKTPEEIQEYKEKLRIQKQSQMEQLRSDLREKKQENIENLCAVLSDKVDGRIKNFDAQKDHHLNRYQKLQEKVTELVTRLEDKDYDTDEVEGDLVELDSLIKDANASYTVFIDKLRAARELRCQASEGKYKEALEVSRAELKVFHADVREIRTFIKETLKPDIQSLRKQKSTNSEE